jgi:hypothetical protein
MANQVTDQEIQSFVRKVRQQLLGLKIEDVRELTENLEADLNDRRNAEGEKFKLSNPKEYAAELAEAAGLNLNELEISRVNLEFLRAWKATLVYFRSLSPAWAILRAWVVFALIYSPITTGGIREIPGNTVSAFVLAVLIAVSVWLSIKQYRPLRFVLITMNVILLLGSPVLVADIASDIQLYKKFVSVETLTTLTFQGNPVTSLCAMDEYGNKQPVVKLFDSAGYPIFVAEGPTRGSC